MSHRFKVLPSVDHYRLFPYVNGKQAKSVCPGFRPNRSY